MFWFHDHQPFTKMYSCDTSDHDFLLFIIDRVIFEIVSLKDGGLDDSDGYLWV